jgi:recombination protein RecA
MTTNLRNQVGENLGAGVCGDSSVYFKDGRKVTIKEVVEEKLGGEILTLNEETGLFEYKKITNWHKIGTVKNKADLVNIQAEGLGKKNGDKNGVISIILTPSHKVLSKRGRKIEASQLVLDAPLISSYMSVQGQVKEVLYAMTVGDSHLYADSKNSKNTAALILNDSENPEYLKWKIDKLSSCITFHKNSLGFVSEYTHDLKLLKDEVSAFEVASLRSPLPFLERHFSLLGFAIWIMDDGHFDKYGCYSLSFGRLAKHKGVLGITSWWFNQRGYENRITRDGGVRFNKKISDKIATDICQFVPKCMEYKLPKHLRNKYKEFDLDYSFELLPEYIKIKSMSDASDRQMNKMRGVYDLEVEGGHNYMIGKHTSGIIVKASN